MEVERISTEKGYEKGYYFHKFRFKGALKHAQTDSQMIVITTVFGINCGYGYQANMDWKNEEDLLMAVHTTDKTPNNAINRSAWILRQLDKLIGLQLED